jgi:branched-chain amino acid aminotransferase
MLRRNGFRQDTYVRPTMYKSTEAIGVRLHNLDDAVTVFAVPFGEYIAIDRGISAQTCRGGATATRPAGALQDRRRLRQQRLLQERGRAQRLRRGDRADHDGHVSEGSAENLFMVRALG